jgi:hypothetical protein
MGDDPMATSPEDGRPLACPEWRDDLAGWLVAQLPPDREAALAAHLDGCDVCRAEAESLLAVAAVSLATDTDAPAAVGLEPPPRHLGERIVASVAAERRHRSRLRAGFVVLAGAAATVVAVIALGSGGGGPEPLEGEEVAFAVVPPGGRAEAVLAADDGGGTVVELTATGLDPDVTYALWLTPPGGGWDDRVAAGTFRPDDDGTVDTRLRSSLPVEEYGRAWATTADGKIALDTE